MEVEFQGPAGRIVGLLEEPELDPRASSRTRFDGRLAGAAVVCHPHPLHEGSMRNTIVFRTARALRQAGLVTLRFNFRGVEGSGGNFDGDGGEEGDAAAALDYLQEGYPGLPLWGTGFSFGARTICALALRDFRIERVVLIAYPVSIYEATDIGRLKQAGLLLFGSGDPFGTLTDLVAKVPYLPEQLETVEIPGADHMFRGGTALLEQSILDYARG